MSTEKNPGTYDIPMLSGAVFAARVHLCRYTCDRCATHNAVAKGSDKRAASFYAWDPACLKRLPGYVSREFPFTLTRLSGIDSHLVDSPADGLVSGRGLARVAKRSREVSEVAKR